MNSIGSGVLFELKRTFGKSMTANAAAAEIRHKILRKINQLDKSELKHQAMWQELKDYIKGMAPRAGKKTGGLGRK